MTKEKITRYVLPTLISVLCLPSAPLATVRLIGLGFAHILDKPDATTNGLLGFFRLLFALVISAAGFVGMLCTACACVLWVWLLLLGKSTVTKIWTLAIVLLAIYGHYLLITVR